MKVNFDTVIRDIHGEPITVQVGAASVPLTLAHTACEALLHLKQDESGADKARGYRLAMKIVSGGEHDVEAEEVVLLKTKIGEIYAPIVVGRAYDALEQRNGIELLRGHG